MWTRSPTSPRSLPSSCGSRPRAGSRPRPTGATGRTSSRAPHQHASDHAPAEGFRAPYLVLDLTDDRGALAGRLLADLGAAVVQLEPPAGTPARRAGAVGAGGDSLFWVAYGHNKRSVVCDLESGDGA